MVLEGRGHFPGKTACKMVLGHWPCYCHFPGLLTLHEICKYLKSTDTFILKVAGSDYFFAFMFSRLVWQLTLDIKPGHRWTKTVVDVLQQPVEAVVVGVLEEANLCATLGKCVMIMDGGVHLLPHYTTTHSNKIAQKMHHQKKQLQVFVVVSCAYIFLAQCLCLRLIGHVLCVADRFTSS